jgi:hypothetical protein
MKINHENIGWGTRISNDRTWQESYMLVYVRLILFFFFFYIDLDTIYGWIHGSGSRGDWQRKDEKSEGLNGNGVCDVGLDSVLYFFVSNWFIIFILRSLWGNILRCWWRRKIYWNAWTVRVRESLAPPCIWSIQFYHIRSFIFYYRRLLSIFSNRLPRIL